jgi:hypothetical protein
MLEHITSYRAQAALSCEHNRDHITRTLTQVSESSYLQVDMG